MHKEGKDRAQGSGKVGEKNGKGKNAVWK